MTTTPAQAAKDYQLFTLAMAARNCPDELEFGDRLEAFHEECTPNIICDLLRRAGFSGNVGAGKVTTLNAGYHLREIAKGELGTISKIREELEELEDAAQQGVLIMQLVELSDMIGAMEAYLQDIAPSMSLQDLIAMQKVTKRAFVNGHRK